MGSKEPTSARALLRGLDLLSIVALSDRPMRLVDIVKESSLPKTTTHRLLNVLVDRGIVIIDAQGRYMPGPLLLSMGMSFLNHVDVRRLALPYMRELMTESQETCHLGVLSFPRVVYVEKVESRQAVRMHSQVGATNPIHCTGLGKALLAFAPNDLVSRICAGTLERKTDNTITDGAELLAELERIRVQGYAIDDVENEPGIRCVASPILDHEGVAIAAISLAGPEIRMTKDMASTLGPRVAEVAGQLSAQVGFIRDLPSV